MGNATTASRDVLAAALRERYAEIAAAWPRAARGEPRAIHRARTASRRLRELLPIIDAVAARSGATRLRREARRLTRVLGPARELDVALEALQDRERTSPAETAVIRTLESRRERAREVLKSRLDRLDLDAFRRRQERVLESIDAHPLGRAGEAAIAKRLRRRAVQVMTSMTAAGIVYSPDALHRVRIAAKKLRYALEISRDLTNAPADVDACISSIRNVQDGLGRIHDLHVLDQLVRVMKWPARPAAQSPVELLDAIERECREQHAGYLARRDVLRAVALHAAHSGSAGRRRPIAMRLLDRSARSLRVVASGR